MLASFGSRFGRRRIWHLRGRVQAHSVSSAAALAGESIPSAVYHAPAMGSMRGTENGSHGVPGRFKSPIVPPVEGVLRAPIAPRHLSDNTAAEAFHEMLSRQGVDHIFGYPGGAIVPAFGAIYTSKQFRCIIPRHEQGAGHMAQGYARISGKPGVVLSSSGASATNLITSMMDAFADGTPMVVFCGHFNTHSTAVNGYDGPDVLALSQPCTKWNVAVRDVEDIPRRIDEAFKIATSGRPGPVLVDLPIKPTSGLYKWPIPSASPGPSHALSPAQVSVTKCRQHEAARSIRHAAGLINMSSKPIIYAGQGILATPKGPRLLRELSEKASIPVTTTLQGLGAFDEEDPKALHMLGLHGSGYANMAIQNADLIIALGARFDDRVTGSIPKFAPKARLAEGSGRGGIIHFDISPKNINKVVQATVPVVGECAENLERLLPQVSPSRRPEWMSQIQAWKAKYPFTAFHHTGRNGAILPQTVIERLSETVDPIKDRTIITTGVGQHQMWAAQHFRWRYPRTMVTSGGLGTMGYGLPAAIGAKAARPDALVIDIDGDASFNMTLNELSTASQFGIDVKVLLLNNEEQGMVTHLQTVYYASRFCHSHNLNPEFVATARAMGIQAESCSSQANIDTKLKWLLETEGPALLEVKVAPKSLSLPMVPAGKGLDEFQFYTD